MKNFFIILLIAFSISCFSQGDSLVIRKEGRFKVAGSVLANAFFSVPRDFTTMGKNISSNWERTAIYATGIVGLIAVDKQTTGFLHDYIEPRVQYSLPDIDPKNIIRKILPSLSKDDAYIVCPIAGLYAGSLIINNKNGQVVAVNAFKSLAYSVVITQIVLKAIASRNRPQRSVNDNNPEVEPFTKDQWDFGNYNDAKIQFGSSPEGTSFPSFHATSYFAVAKVFQMEYDNYWIPYTFVTGVFLSNIKSHEHWVSDLLVGGLVGTIIGRSIVLSSRKQMTKSENNNIGFSHKKFKMHKQLIPQISSNRVGLQFIGTF